jgi:hypothetical protein
VIKWKTKKYHTVETILKSNINIWERAKINTLTQIDDFIIICVRLYISKDGLWSYGSWIYNYLCNQCLSTLTLWVRIPFMARCTRYNIMWSSVSDLPQISGFLRYSGFLHQWNWPPRYNWILLKVMLNTISVKKSIYYWNNDS